MVLGKPMRPVNTYHVVAAFTLVAFLTLLSVKFQQVYTAEDASSLFEDLFGPELQTVGPLNDASSTNEVALDSVDKPHGNSSRNSAKSHNKSAVDVDVVFNLDLPTLYDCYQGKAKRVSNFEAIPVFSEWTGDVLLQTDNRQVDFENVSAWQYRGHWEVSFVYNSIVSRKSKTLHVFIHGAKNCTSPYGKLLVGYWCKVPAIRAAVHMFPNARSLIYIDSDAYLREGGSVNAFYNMHEFNFGKDGPIYAQHDRSFWKLLVQFAYTERFALNSGALLFSPRSEVAKTALNLWWQAYTNPTFLSRLDAYKSQVRLMLYFSESCAFSNVSTWVEDLSIMQRFRKAFAPLVSNRTMRVPIENFFDPSAVILKDRKARMQWVARSTRVKSSRYMLFVRFGHYANAGEIDAVEKDINKGPGSLQLALENIIGCKAKGLKMATERSNDFGRGWPGDQDRLQHLREEFPEYVKVLYDLALLSRLRKDSLYMNHLVWHPCWSMRMKDDGKKRIFKYLSEKVKLKPPDMIKTLKSIPALCLANTQNL